MSIRKVEEAKTEQVKEFKRLSNQFIDYLYKYGTPHTKIIIDMSGAEQLDGTIGIPFEIRD